MASGQKNKDLYHILGVAPGASTDEIKKSYRRKAREMHPDIDHENPWAEDDFKDLSAAYQILSDKNQRAKYDRGELNDIGRKRRTSSKKPDAKAESGKPNEKQKKKRPSDFDGFFRDRGGPDIDGVDVNYVLKVDFLEAARGADREMKTTNGSKLKVKVPPGTISGQVLRLKGQGMRGFGKGRDGDAMIEVEVEPHPIFKCDGRDISTEEPVGLEEAILGGKIQVETIDGIVSVSVPKNANTGTKLRLKGRGLADGGRKGGARGDHYVTLVVTLPNKPDPELEEFIRKRSEKDE